MGIDDSIMDLKKQDFIIKKDGENYRVSFNKNDSEIWENYIISHLKVGFWNEYLADNKVIFIFCLESGIKRYEVEDYKSDEVLALCEKLCDCEFESIKSMLCGNDFYKDKIK